MLLGPKCRVMMTGCVALFLASHGLTPGLFSNLPLMMLQDVALWPSKFLDKISALPSITLLSTSRKRASRKSRVALSRALTPEHA